MYKIKFIGKIYYAKSMRDILFWVGDCWCRFFDISVKDLVRRSGFKSCLRQLQDRDLYAACYTLHNSYPYFKRFAPKLAIVIDGENVSTDLDWSIKNAINFIIAGNWNEANLCTIKVLRDFALLTNHAGLLEKMYDSAATYLKTKKTSSGKFIDINLINSSLLCAGIRPQTSWLRTVNLR